MYIKCDNIVISTPTDTTVTDCCINVDMCKDFYLFGDSVIFRYAGSEYTLRLKSENEAKVFYKEILEGIKNGMKFISPDEENEGMVNLYIN